MLDTLECVLKLLGSVVWLKEVYDGHKIEFTVVITSVALVCGPKAAIVLVEH